MKLYEDFKLFEEMWNEPGKTQIDPLEEGIFDLLKTKTQKADFIKKTLNKQFVVVCCKNRLDRVGSLIKHAVSQEDFSRLTIDKSKTVNTFAEVEKTAKEFYEPATSNDFGRSSDGSGPIFVYVANNVKDSDKIYLCQYFNNKLVVDNIDKVFKKVSTDVKNKAEALSTAVNNTNMKITKSELKEMIREALREELGSIRNIN